MRFERVTDMGRVRETITHPQIYPHVSDGGAPLAEEFEPVEHPAIIYLGAFDGEDYGGLFMFAPQSSACFEVHTCLLPIFWGPRAWHAACGAARWIWLNTSCRRIITSVPIQNRLALRLAKRAGFIPYGRNEKSWLKGGIMHDQICLGLTYPGLSCQ